MHVSHAFCSVTKRHAGHAPYFGNRNTPKTHQNHFKHRSVSEIKYDKTPLLKVPPVQSCQSISAQTQIPILRPASAPVRLCAPHLLFLRTLGDKSSGCVHQGVLLRCTDNDIKLREGKKRTRLLNDLRNCRSHRCSLLTAPGP